LTIEPSDGSVFGLPPTVPAGTNLLLFNVADVPYQMTILEKNPSVTDSWDVILACGVTSNVATVVGSVIAQPGGGAEAGVTVANEGEDLLALIPLAAPAESAAPSAAPTEAPSVAPSVVPSEAPSAAASEAAGSPAASIAAEPTATPAPTCPPGGIAGASSAPSESAAVPSIAASPSAAASQAPASTKPHKTPKSGKPGKTPKPTATPAPTPIAGIPDLTNAAWQLFTVTPAGTLPGETAAP